MTELSYEICKKLKDAGFDQFGKGEPCWGERFEEEQVYVPTLEELIEAIGYPFSMIRFGKGVKNAMSGEIIEGMYQAFNSEDSILCESGFGSTPEEAVANLWLKLNKK